MMIMMIIIATVMISSNAALTAQRDFLGVKDSKGFRNNVNVISNANGNADIAGENAVNSIGAATNRISNEKAVGSHNSMASIPQSVANIISSSMTHTQATAIVTASTVVSYSRSTIASRSLQKAGGNTNGHNGIGNELLDDSYSGPYFDKAFSKNVTALLGKTAYLNCRVKNLSNKTMFNQVSWIRHRDVHLLTIGRYTYTSDQRFRAIYQPQTEDWILQIKYPQHRDSGIYECQVSTTPHMSHYIYLNVVEPTTEIFGGPDLYIESGSTINLTCVILNSPEPPAFIFWNHNNAIINYDSPRGGISVFTNQGEKMTTSFLIIQSAKPTDSGIYQCNPSNAKPQNVTVHVLNGEIPSAMQRASLMHHRMSQSHYLLVYLSLYFFTLAYMGRYMRFLQPITQSTQ